MPNAKKSSQSHSPPTNTGRSKAVRVVSVAVVAAAVLGAWLKHQLVPTHRYLPWHQTPYWREFLKIYDTQASEYYLNNGGACQAKMLDTTYGQTHAFACGSKNRRPVFFFHGGGLNALMYGRWILPQLMGTRYVVAVDSLCDTGRSLPAQSDPDRCPRTEEEIADWVRQVVTHKDLGAAKGRASLVGYSYGALVSFLAARYHADLVDRLALLAPACVFEELEMQFLWRALAMALLRSRRSQSWFWRWMSVDPHFDLSTSVSPELVLQLDASREVAGTLFAVPAQAYPDDILAQVAQRHPIFLGLGEGEVVLKNVTVAVERAHRAGVRTVQVYRNAGHLLFLEQPEAVERDVVAFLQK